MVYFLRRKRGAVESNERTNAAVYRRRPAPGLGSDRLPHDRHRVLRRGPGDEYIGERGELSGQVHSRVCVRATSASVSALIGPGGQTTTYKVLYDLASSEWCATAGLKGSPANSTAPQTLGFTDFSGHQVVVHLSGLTSDQRYCEAPQASNGSGSSTGSVISFVSGAPTARTFFVNVTGSSSATVIGSVDPAGQPTKYHVVYDLATSEWCSTFGEKGSPSKSTAETALASADTSEHKVDIGLTGLTAGKSYCAAVSASNASATVTGNPSTFDLIASPPIAEASCSGVTDTWP